MYVAVCCYVYDVVSLMLNLKATRFGIMFSRTIKIEHMHVHCFYNKTQSGWDDDDDTVFV